MFIFVISSMFHALSRVHHLCQVATEESLLAPRPVAAPSAINMTTAPKK
jgi:hypothetical protein